MGPIRGDPSAEEDLVLLASALIERGFRDEEMLSQFIHLRSECNAYQITRAIDEAKRRVWKPESMTLEPYRNGALG